MEIKNYDELTTMEIDTLREIGSIGTGNAAAALSVMLGRNVRITLPEVRIMGYNEAIEWIGGPEAITAGVIERTGLGLAFPDKNAITAPALRRAILALLNEPSYRETAKDFSEDMKTLGGAQASADAVIRFLEK